MDGLACFKPAVAERQRGEGAEREDNRRENKVWLWMEQIAVFCGFPFYLVCPRPPWPPPNNLT